jgi:Fe-S-cluster containining protein
MIDRPSAPLRASCSLLSLNNDLPACAGCGRCCHLVVELRPGDIVPEELVAVHAGARCMDQHSDGACVALDPATRLCTIYETRPQTCRDFNRGESLCRKILGVAR